MKVLLDTNILLRLVQPDHPSHPAAVFAVEGLKGIGKTLHIVPQNLYEFWVVATRPANVQGIGFTSAKSFEELEVLQKLFSLLPETQDILIEWKKLIVAHDCKGKPAHDARLVAAMKAHSIGEILTFNGGDFVRYTAIRVLDPHTCLASAP